MGSEVRVLPRAFIKMKVDSVGIEEFIEKKTHIFTLILGLIIFYNFVYATNLALKSFLWFFSSIIIITLMCYIFLEALSSKTSGMVKLIIGLPLSMITLAFTLQVVISLFEPENIYSLNVISRIFTLDFLYQILGTIIFLVVLIVILFLTKRKNNPKTF